MFATAAKWFRLIVASALSELMREERGLPVLALLDEFAQLGHLKAMRDAMGQSAGMGLQVLPVLQSCSSAGVRSSESSVICKPYRNPCSKATKIMVNDGRRHPGEIARNASQGDHRSSSTAPGRPGCVSGSGGFNSAASRPSGPDLGACGRPGGRAAGNEKPRDGGQCA
jgi:hypothetical protein